MNAPLIVNQKKTLLSRGLWLLINILAIASVSFASHAAIYTVDTDSDDMSNYTNGSSACGSPCSLRAAIRAANSATGADEIFISEGINPYLSYGDSDPKSIDENAAKLDDLDITDDVKIRGSNNAERNVISAGGLSGGVGDRVFHVLNGANVTFQNISIQDGQLTVETEQGSDGNKKIIGNPAGAGILIEAGSVVTLIDVGVTQNSITTRSLADFNTVGGGIYVANSATLIANDSEITYNKAPSGGGIANAGRAEIRRTLIDNNDATDRNDPASRSVSGGGGGGINNQGGYLSLGSSTLSNNSSTQLGGGIYFANQGQNNGSIIITNSVIYNNHAEFGGAGIANLGPLSINNSAIVENSSASLKTPGNRGNGAGIYNFSLGSLDMVNSTVSHNSGAYSGGGIFSSRNMSLTNVTIYDNEATPCSAGNVNCSDNSQVGGNQIALFTSSSVRPNLILSNTIIGNGADSNLNEPPCAGSTGYTSDIKSLGYNIESHNSCGLREIEGDQTDVTDLGLTALDQDPNPPEEPAIIDGQSTTLLASRQVNALTDGSPAIDSGNNNTCPLVDQRFMLRDNNCDVGAYEYGATDRQATGLVDLKVTIADTPDPVAPRNNQQPLNYIIVITNLYENTPAISVTMTVNLPNSFAFASVTSAATSGVKPNCTFLNPGINTMTCDIGTVTGLGRAEVFISGQPQIEGTIQASVSVFSETPDAFPQNNLNITVDTVVDAEAGSVINFGGNGGAGGGMLHPLTLLLTALILLGRRFRASAA